MAQQKEHLLNIQELDAVAPLTTLGQTSALTAETIRSPERGAIRRPPPAAIPLGSRVDVKASIRPQIAYVDPPASEETEKKDAAGRVTVEEIHVPSQLPRSSTADVLVCSVCLGEAQNGDPIRITPCSHRFHDGCLAEWLTSYQNRCPMCQRCLKPGRTE
jgi:hypothetical protein